MEENLYTIHIDGRFPRYQINLFTLQDRRKKFDGWTRWEKIPEESWDFYKNIEPEMIVKRNKLIHEREKK